MQSIWVLIPTAQQIHGGWIDDILKESVEQKGITRYSLAGRFPRQRLEVIKGNDPVAAANELFYKRGWTDGLPIVPPTAGKVREMLAYTDKQPSEIIGIVDPLKGIATVEKVAVNAVMAGCRPEYFPVIIVALKAVIEPEFDLIGIQTTDENVTPLMIISGPLARQLDMNSSFGVLGPGWQANATIGRALRLVMNNIGGGWPWAISLAGIGQPGRYTLCLAENEEASPWEPLRVELGYGEEMSTITAMRAETAINITGGLTEVASVMGSLASAFTMLHSGQVAVLLAPFVARELASKGWNKDDVKRFLYEHGRISAHQWEKSWIHTLFGFNRWPQWVRESAKRGHIPAVRDPSDITVVVAGGDLPIPQHVYFPSWGAPPCSITRQIKLPANWELLLEKSRRSVDFNGPQTSNDSHGR